MKTKNPPKKLTVNKTTLAHLNPEQMNTVKAGEVLPYDWKTDGCTTTYNP